MTKSTKKLKITFLGTGTSQGVPVIGCDCKVCLSPNPRDKRLRTSAMVQWENEIFIIDVGPDFRQQLLREKVSKVSAILMTHEHNDHIIGMDDVRPLNFLHRKPVVVYAEDRVQKELKERFAYIFDAFPYPGAPRLTLKDINPHEDIIYDYLRIKPIRAWHGQLPVLGYRFKDFTYLTDINRVEETELERVKGTQILALDALHHNMHHSHFNLDQALDFVEKIKPKQTYLIHISHRMGFYDEINAQLPANVMLAYDGLRIEL